MMAYAVNTEDQRIMIWAKVKLGGERPVDVGREMGYRDGSGILQVIKRLEVTHDRSLREKMVSLKRLVSSVES